MIPKFYHSKLSLKLINFEEKMKFEIRNKIKFKLIYVLNIENKPIKPF